jgi:hypothetical protein
MPDIKEAQGELIARILEGTGHSSISQRRAAFNNSGLTGPVASLVSKIADQAYAITDADISAAKATGISEDQLYEIAVCAAVGQATRQQQSALAALDLATKE